MTYKSAVLNRYPAKVEDFYRQQDDSLALATLAEFGVAGALLEGIVPIYLTGDGRPDWGEVTRLSQGRYEETLQGLDAMQ